MCLLVGEHFFLLYYLGLQLLNIGLKRMSEGGLLLQLELSLLGSLKMSIRARHIGLYLLHLLAVGAIELSIFVEPSMNGSIL